MKRLSAILSLILSVNLVTLAVIPALAADLPAKAMAAAPAPTCTVTNCSGAYAGFDIEGAGPIATGQADLTNGAGIGGHIGYQLWNGSLFAAIEVGATGYFGASTFTPTPGVIVGPGNWSTTYTTKIGYGLQGFFNSGSITAPSQGLFANLSANLITPYVEVGGRTRGFEGLGAKTGFLAGAGLQYSLGNRWTLDVKYRHIDYSQSGSVGGVPVSIGTESTASIGVNYMF
jgi:opacity protein-like surface antigen